MHTYTYMYTRFAYTCHFKIEAVFYIQLFVLSIVINIFHII